MFLQVSPAGSKQYKGQNGSLTRFTLFETRDYGEVSSISVKTRQSLFTATTNYVYSLPL